MASGSFRVGARKGRSFDPLGNPETAVTNFFILNPSRSFKTENTHQKSSIWEASLMSNKLSDETQLPSVRCRTRGYGRGDSRPAVRAGVHGGGPVAQGDSASDPPQRSQIARRACRALDWTDVLSRPKLMSARVGLLRLHRAGIIELPLPSRG